jgi:hypothetical protein
MEESSRVQEQKSKEELSIQKKQQESVLRKQFDAEKLAKD